MGAFTLPTPPPAKYTGGIKIYAAGWHMRLPAMHNVNGFDNYY